MQLPKNFPRLPSIYSNRHCVKYSKPYALLSVIFTRQKSINKKSTLMAAITINTMFRLFLQASIGVLFSCTMLVHAQNNHWLRRAGSAGMDEALDMAKDSSGNIYVTGYFTGNCAFQYSPSLVLTSSGADDIFVAKYDKNGTLLWAVKAGGFLSDRGKSIAVTPNGNVYITGEYRGTCIFGNFSLTSVANSPDVFVAKLNTNGVFQWVKTGGGQENDLSYSIATDTSGNCVVTGQYSNSVNFGVFNATSMINPNTSVFSYDVFIVRYDANGNEMWLKHGTAKYADRGMAVGMDLASNSYIVMQYSDTITFSNMYPNVSYNVMGVMKLDALGNEVWFQKAGGASMLIGYDIFVDKNGNSFITGDFKGSIYFYGTPNVYLQGTHDYNIFICRYAPNGQILWAKSSGSDNEVTSRAITLDSWNDIYVTGHFKCTMTEFSAYYGGTGLFNSVGYNDVFVAKYKFSQGVFQYARQYGSKLNDNGYGIVINTMNKPYICGSHAKQLNIPANPNNNWVYHDNNNNQNLYWLVNNNSNKVPQTTPYCNDDKYNNYLCLKNNGNSDMFIGNFIDTTRAPYDYYHRSGNNCQPDYISPCINGKYPPIIDTTYNQKPFLNDFTCVGDTILICDTGTIWVSTNTSLGAPYFHSSSTGPAFKFLWNTGDTIRYKHIGTSGIYSVKTTSYDGCYSFSDTIYADVVPYPQPIVSDDYIVHTNWPYNYTIGICGPDTVTLTGGNYQGNSYNWNGIQDSIVVVNSTGNYYWNLENPKGCKKSLHVKVVIDTIPPQLPPFVPKLVFNPNSDTIKLCAGQYFTWYVLDSLSNQCMKKCTDIGSFLNGNIYYPDFILITSCYDAKYYPSSTGWYVFEINFRKDTVNYCGKDSVFFSIKDSVYVIVNPLPNAFVTLTGNPLLCPGDTGVLYANGTGNYTWGGPSPVYMIGDSIAYIVAAGIYSVKTTVTDTNGCSNTQTKYFTVQLKTATLTTNPNPALICPNDSVQLIAPPGLSYDWYGPYGFITTTTNNTFWVTNPGMYYVVMYDMDTCELVSNMVEVKQYTTPDLVVLPNNIICPGDSAKLVVLASPGATVQWLAPLSGNQMFKYVDSTGTYSCQVTSCGIVTTLSVYVKVSTPLAIITPQGNTKICPGDSVLLNANLGMVDYLWFPGGSMLPFLYAKNPGMYILKTTNNDGCSAYDTVFITIDSIAPPVVNDTTVCYGFGITLQAYVPSGTIQWYADSLKNNLLGTGNTFTTLPLFNDTTFWVSVIDSCESLVVPLKVFIDTASLVPNIYVNNPTCVGGFLNFSASFFNNGIYNWTGPNGFTANTQSFTINNVTLQDSGWYYLTIIANSCTSMVGSVKIIILDSLPNIKVYTNSPVCEGDTLFLSADTINYVSYSWLGSNGFTSGVQNNTIPNVQLSDSGIYTVTISLLGCGSKTASDTVQIIPKPTTPQIYYNNPLCEGDTLFLYSNFGQNTIHNWAGPNNFSSNNYIAEKPNMLQSDTGVYYLTVNINGCNSDTAAVFVYVGKYPNPFTVNPVSPVCEGDSLVLSVQPNQTGCTYTWVFNNGYFDFGNPCYLYNIDSSYSGMAYITVTSPDGCSLTDSVFITVYPMPFVNLSNNGPICQNGTLMLYSDTINGATYSWTGPNGFTSSQQNPIIPNVDTTYNGFYVLTVTSQYGCTYTDSTFAIITNNLLQVFPYGFNYCTGDTLYLGALCLQNVTYSWVGPNGFSSSLCEPKIPNASPINSGTYTVTATLGNCSNNGESISININPPPNVNLGPDTTVCDTITYLLYAGNFAWYQWQDYSNLPTYAVTQPGTYYVTVSDSLGCSATDTIVVNMYPCGGNLKISNVFTPNGDGMNDYFIIRPEGVNSFKLSIFNRWGVLMFEANEHSRGWDGKTASGENCAEGTYYYVFTSEQLQLKGYITLMR